MRTRAVALILIMLVLAGCRRPAKVDVGAAHVPPGQNVRTAPGQTTVGAAPAPPGGMSSTTTQFPDPGPYQTVVVKNADGSDLEAIQARGEVGKPGGTLRLSTFQSGPKTFNPWDAADVTSDGIGYLQFERLVGLDAWTGKIYPRLAKSFTISPDSKQYTFVLRKGLKWSDGKPLTADDVVFTFDTLVRHGYGQGSNSERDELTVYGQYPKVEKIDDLTVRFTTAAPFAPFLNALQYPIAPKHILAQQAQKPIDQFGTMWDVNTDPATMVVSGPFILERYVKDERIELKRNPNWFFIDKQGSRLPYLDRFVITVAPDQSTQVLKFYANEIDFLDVRSVRGNDVGTMKRRMDQSHEFGMYNLGPDDGTTFLMLNMNRRKNPKGKPYVDPVKSAWFNDVRFRQAVSHAINRQRIVDNAMKGVGQPLYTPESTASIFFNKQLQPYGQDLELSKRLLHEAGFVNKEEGNLYDSKGNRVEFTLMTNAGNSTRDSICVSIADALKQLGMKVNYQPVDFNILIDKTANSLDWEAIVMGLSGNKVEPYEGSNVWKTGGRMHMFDQRIPDSNGEVKVTDARDWEKRIDEIFNKAATTLDIEKRRAYWNEYQQIVYDQLPFIYLATMLDITAMRNRVGNYKPTPLGISYTPMGSLHNIEEIYVKDNNTK